MRESDAHSLNEFIQDTKYVCIWIVIAYVSKSVCISCVYTEFVFVLAVACLAFYTATKRKRRRTVYSLSWGALIRKNEIVRMMKKNRPADETNENQIKYNKITENNNTSNNHNNNEPTIRKIMKTKRWKSSKTSTDCSKLRGKLKIKCMKKKKWFVFLSLVFDFASSYRMNGLFLCLQIQYKIFIQMSRLENFIYDKKNLFVYFRVQLLIVSQPGSIL